MSTIHQPAANETPRQFPTFPDLKGKIVVITGIGQVGVPNSSTWGNGAACARLFSLNNAKVFGCDLNLSAAEYTRDRILKDNPDAICDVIACDVTKSTDVEAFVQAAMQKHGRIDILVNNVGATVSGSPSSMREDQWLQQIDLNLHSVYRCCHAVIPIMEAQGGGSIVNNGSITALRYIGKPQIGYATAKAAVVRYTKTAGVMYAAKDIRFNAVIPGLMYTPLVENFGMSEKEEDQETFRRITEHNVPMGRLGDSFDVANAVIWLASDAARYVTAHALVVDGGITESTGTGE